MLGHGCRACAGGAVCVQLLHARRGRRDVGARHCCARRRVDYQRSAALAPRRCADAQHAAAAKRSSVGADEQAAACGALARCAAT